MVIGLIVLLLTLSALADTVDGEDVQPDDNQVARNTFRIGLVTYTPKGLMYTPGTDSVMLAMQDAKSVIEYSRHKGDGLDMVVFPESMTAWSCYYDSYEDILGYTSQLPELGSYEAKYGDKNSSQLYVYSRLARENNIYIVAEILEEVPVKDAPSLVQSKVIVVNRNGEMIAAGVSDTELKIKNLTQSKGGVLKVNIPELSRPIVIVSGLDWVDLNKKTVGDGGIIIMISQFGLTPYLSVYDVYRTYQDKLGIPVAASSVIRRGGIETNWEMSESGVDTDFEFYIDVIEVKESVNNMSENSKWEVELVTTRALDFLGEKQMTIISTQYQRGYGNLGYNKLISSMAIDWYSRNTMGLNMIDLSKVKDNLDCSNVVPGKCRSFILTRSARIKSKTGAIDISNPANKKLKVLVYNIKVSAFTFEAAVIIGESSGVILTVIGNEDETVLLIPSNKLEHEVKKLGETRIRCGDNDELCGVLIPRRHEEENN